MLDSDRPTGSVLGYDIGGTKVRAALAAPDGTVLAERMVPSERPGARLIDQVGRLAGELRATAGNPPGPVCAALGLPGTPDPGTGRVSRCPAFPDLADVDARAAFATALGCPVVLHNDVNLAAVAEAVAGGHPTGTVAVLALGTGIGLGTVVDGRILVGDDAAAGEIADLPVTRAGRTVPLESVASIAGLTAAYRSAGGPDTATVPDIVAGTDPAAVTALDTYCDAVAHGIAAAVAVTDPGVLVLTGGIGAAPGIAARVSARLRELGPWRLPIRTSVFATRAPLVGALHVAGEQRRTE